MRSPSVLPPGAHRSAPPRPAAPFSVHGFAASGVALPSALSNGLATPMEGPPTVPPGARMGRLERLPKWLNLVPMVAQWVWLSLCHRAITLPSCANPAITSGGMVGEGKLEYLDTMGPLARAACAVTTSFVNGGADPSMAAESAMARAGLTYPVVLKPDLGWCGFGVRLVPDRASLEAYAATFPVGERVVVQAHVRDEGEAGLFYVRHPGKPHGRLIGVLLRHAPSVVGDGHRTIAQLMAASPRLRRLGRDGLSEAGCDTARVPGAGEVVPVTTVRSTRVGGLYEDGTRHITPELTRAIDRIALDMDNFHMGRFDVKFTDLAALRAGRGLTVIEVNGAGSEAVHAWDPSLTLRQAYGIIFRKQRELFAIGDEMRRRGHKPVGLVALLRLHLRQQRLIQRYPPSN